MKPLGYVEIGNRVMLTRDTLMDRGGALGTVIRKYVPSHCTGVWAITIRWDGNAHETGYSYPTDLVARVEGDR